MESASLRDVIKQWLEFKLVHAERLKARSLGLFQHERSDYSLGQYTYSKHQVAAIEWLISQIPKRFELVRVPRTGETSTLAMVVDHAEKEG